MAQKTTLSDLHFGLDQVGRAQEGEPAHHLLRLRLDVLKLCAIFFSFLIIIFKVILIMQQKIYK
jgi:hypothetical protein